MPKNKAKFSFDNVLPVDIEEVEFSLGESVDDGMTSSDEDSFGEEEHISFKPRIKPRRDKDQQGREHFEAKKEALPEGGEYSIRARAFMKGCKELVNSLRSSKTEPYEVKHDSPKPPK